MILNCSYIENLYCILNIEIPNNIFIAVNIVSFLIQISLSFISHLNFIKFHISLKILFGNKFFRLRENKIKPIM